MSRKVVLVVAFALLILMGLSVFWDMLPMSSPQDDAALQQELAARESQKRLDQAVQKAKGIREDELFDFYSLMAGYKVGEALHRTYKGLRPEHLDEPVLLQGLREAFADTEPFGWELFGSPEANAAELAWVRSKGGELRALPKDLPAQDKALVEQVMRMAEQMNPEQAAREAHTNLGRLIWLHSFSLLPQASIKDLREPALLEGLRLGLSGKSPEIDALTLQAYGIATTWTIDARTRAMAEKNKTEGEAYLRRHAAEPGVVTTASGLQYRVLQPGGSERYDAERHGANPTCTISYEGRRVDGSCFDRTSEQSPVSFPINGVVPGFSEALKLMPVGAEWEVALPASLAYGDRAPALIGPNAVLIFRIRLHELLPSEQLKMESPSTAPQSAAESHAQAPQSSEGAARPN